MKRTLQLLPFLCCVLLAHALAQNPQPADVVVVNARIYTVNPKQPWAEALAVRDGRIAAVGSASEIAPHRGPKTRVIDAGGRLALPGFTDAHIHFLGGSLSLDQLDLLGTTTVAEMQKMVREYAAARPDAPWILGRGWIYTSFGEEALPHKRFLNEIVADRPVFLRSSDGHSSWANSKALQIAGITRDTPDPPNGVIVRDLKGEPTGALKEAASGLVSKFVPEPTPEQKLVALRMGIQEANRAGLVRVHSCGGDFQALDLFDRLRREGELTLRIYAAHSVGPKGLQEDDLRALEKGERYRDEWLSAGAVKTMLDGVIESHTAALLAPYADEPSQAGKMFWDAATYKKAIGELDRRGIQVFTHAIGEGAVRLALDAYEAAQKSSDRRLRHRIEHIETVAAEDLPRFGKLGVIGSFQPLHANPEESWIGVWKRNVGPQRIPRAFPWQSVAGGGGALAFGSDWPVVTLNPWKGLQIAVTRKALDGQPAEGWVPEQKVTLEQAIHAYTLGAAFAGRREQTEGSLEPGKLADLIILSQDLFKIAPGGISKTEVLLTMVGGKVVYAAEPLERGR